MQLESIQFENYKAFKNEQIFKLKPITLVIGKNSSGKSALSRLPFLFSRSFTSERNEPIKMKIDNIEFGGAFVDLIHNQLPHGSIKIRLNFESAVSLSFEVQNISNSPIQIIKKWTFSSPSINFDFDYDLLNNTSRNNIDLVYNSNNNTFLISFKGLVPASIKNKNGELVFTEEIKHITQKLLDFATKIEYIGPFRAFPERNYRYLGAIPDKMGTKGENATQILGMTSLIDETLLHNVSEWYKKNLGGWTVEIFKETKTFDVVLVSPDDSNVKINIVDVGQGMSQVLPLVVRCYINSNKQGSIEIFEQPELHLHPAAHAELAELLAITAKKESSTFIIETHSENIILRIRKLVVDGILNIDDVIIYWVNDESRPGSNIQEITIDEMGILSDWPDGVFSEDHDEIIKIRNAQKNKSIKK